MAFLWKVTRSLRRLSAEDTGLYGFADCVDDDGGGHIRVRHTRTRLLLQALLVTMLLVGVGVTGVFADNALQRVGKEQVETAARLSENARLTYKFLVKADSSATGYLLIRFMPKRKLKKLKVSPQRMWKDYDDAIRQVEKQLIKMTVAVGGNLSRKADIDRIIRQLSVYDPLVGEAKKLIDEARKVIASAKGKRSYSVETKSAIGRAVLGASRMHEASFYMDKTLLQAAMDFWKHETDNLCGARGSAFRSWVSRLLLLLAGLGGLAWIQWSLARRTHRFLNYGLLGATVLIVAMLGVTGWLPQSWSKTKEGLVGIEKELNAQEKRIDTEKKMQSASAKINLFLIGASLLDSDALKSFFQKPAGCAADKNESLCNAYDKFIDSPLAKGDNFEAAIAALPGGDFAREFEAAGQENVKDISARVGEIEQKAKGLPLAPRRSRPLIVLLCSCAAVCAGLGFWVRIKEYL